MIAGVTALAAWIALGLQLVLIIDTMSRAGASTPEAVWRFFGFFTILTNILVAITATAIALGSRSVVAGPHVRLAAAAAILLVGIVYSVALRAVWSPTGLQAVADHALHDATPVLFLMTWLTADHPGLSWRAAVWALPWPLLYVVYALMRGAADGWYAYWFLNPATLGAAQMALSVALLVGVVLIIALALTATDRRLARRGRPT